MFLASIVVNVNFVVRQLLYCMKFKGLRLFYHSISLNYCVISYSFDEMGKYDLPAMIDFALNVTGQQHIFYVGHSQGTTCMFAALSENPELNKKVSVKYVLFSCLFI